jgi:ABC-type multidrug transport system fused ATPase/permease subunit
MHYKPKKIPLRKIAIPLLTTMLISAVLSSPVLIPHVIYAPFFSGPLNASVTFPKLQDLFFSPWRYGLLFQGPKGELSFAVGYVHLLFMALAIIILWRNKNQTSKHLKFWLFCTGLLFFLLIPYSSIVWKTIPLIHTVQFATRLLILITLCLSLIGGYTAMFLQKEQRILIILIALSIMLTILNWGHRRVIPEISDSTLYKLLETSTAQGEGLARLEALKWLDENDPWQKKKPDSPLRVIKGKASYQLLERKSQLHRYRISVEEDAVFSENTLFFPNWRIFIDNKIIPAQYTVDSIKGMLRFSLPKGYYTVRIEFIDDYFVKTSKLFSLLGFSLIIPFFTYHIIFRHRK